MKKSALFAACGLALSAAANAAVNVNALNTTYTENFDGLAASTTLSDTAGTHAALPNTGWEATRIAGSSSSALPYISDDGSSNSGSIRNASIGASSDHALGAISSGSNTPAFGVAFTNNTGSTITGFTLVFDAEQYRTSTSTQNVLSFAYGVTGGGATLGDYLSAASGMTALAAGDITGTAPVSSNGQGYTLLGADQTVTVTGLNVAAGQSIFLRWQDFNDVGNDAVLAIDNVRFTAVPTPASAALLGLGGLVGGAARRRRA